jgi:hypothetical protein
MNNLSRKAQIAGAARRIRERNLAAAEREIASMALLIRRVDRRIRWHKRIQELLSRTPRT